MVSFEHASEGERRQRHTELQPLPCPELSLPPNMDAAGETPMGTLPGEEIPEVRGLDPGRGAGECVWGGWGAGLGCNGPRERVRAAVSRGPRGAELGAEAVKGEREKRDRVRVLARKLCKAWGWGCGGTIPVQMCTRGLCMGSAAALCRRRGSPP